MHRESYYPDFFYKSLSSTSKKLMQQVLHYFFLVFFAWTCQYQVIYYALKKSQDNWRFLWWMSDLLSSFIFWLSSDFFCLFFAKLSWDNRSLTWSGIKILKKESCGIFYVPFFVPTRAKRSAGTMPSDKIFNSFHAHKLQGKSFSCHV